MTQTMLRTHALTKRYGDFSALNQVSLTLNRGDIYGLVGRNGAGKTTFFKCVMGLARPTSGVIEIAEKRTKLDRERRHIGFVINAVFFPYLSARRSLEYLCRVKGIRARRSEIDRLLKLVHLDGVKKPFKTFSLGMKQRLGLAGALLGSPPLVVLDEPINGLDPQGIADIREIILQENHEKGTTFIVSSHILSELDLVAGRFGFIEQGRLVQEISHADLHAHTKKALVIEVGAEQGERALDVLRGAGLHDAELAVDNRLLVTTGLDQPNLIAQVLVGKGFELFKLAPQEATLEDYFMHLISGHNGQTEPVGQTSNIPTVPSSIPTAQGGLHV